MFGLSHVSRRVAGWFGRELLVGMLTFLVIASAFQSIRKSGHLGYAVWLRLLLVVSSLAGIIILGYRISRIRLDDWTVPNVLVHVVAMIVVVNVLIAQVPRPVRGHGKEDAKSWPLTDELS